jgi:hypothetical protein
MHYRDIRMVKSRQCQRFFAKSPPSFLTPSRPSGFLVSDDASYQVGEVKSRLESVAHGRDISLSVFEPGGLCAASGCDVSIFANAGMLAPISMATRFVQ